jgi:hypothetical protein
MKNSPFSGNSKRPIITARPMHAEFVNPFLQAASEVLETELGTEPTRGPIGLRRSAYTSWRHPSGRSPSRSCSARPDRQEDHIR